MVKAGEIDLSTVFIDGTKIEAQANRYTFVWKKSVEKRLAKLMEKMRSEWAKLWERNGLHETRPEKIQTHHVKKLLKRLKTRASLLFLFLMFHNMRALNHGPMLRFVRSGLFTAIGKAPVFSLHEVPDVYLVR